MSLSSSFNGIRRSKYMNNWSTEASGFSECILKNYLITAKVSKPDGNPNSVPSSAIAVTLGFGRSG
jgi:hypothetical protein